MTNERLAEIEKYFAIFKFPKKITDFIKELINTVKEQKEEIHKRDETITDLRRYSDGGLY